jgi:CheY-like chemotaxis protein
MRSPFDLTDPRTRARPIPRAFPGDFEKIGEIQEKRGRAVCHDLAVASTAVVVDDHPSFRRFARRLMEAGFVVVGEAGDGASALASVRETRPRLVLLDVLLPDTSGFEVADLLAAEPDCPVVVLTSSRSAAELGPSLARTSADAFLTKSDLTPAALAAYLALE